MAKKKAKTWVMVEIKYDGNVCKNDCDGDTYSEWCTRFNTYRKSKRNLRTGTTYTRCKQCIDNECEEGK